jgi:hypothetical protein
MADFDRILSVAKHVRVYDHYAAMLCPFHDDRKPSLLVYRDGWFICKACQARGTLETLYRQLAGWSSFPATPPVNWSVPRIPQDLGELEDIAWAAHEALLSFDSLRWYLRMRGVEDRIETCYLGWHEGWYTIPVFDRDMEFHGLCMRAGRHIEEITGLRFYAAPAGVWPTIYCPRWADVMEAKRVAVVFGLFDALALCSLRIPVFTVAGGGKGAFKAEWLDDFRVEIVIIPDEGEEPEALTLANQLGWRGSVHRLHYPDGLKDPCDFLEHGKRQQLEAELCPLFL